MANHTYILTLITGEINEERMVICYGYTQRMSYTRQ